MKKSVKVITSAALALTMLAFSGCKEEVKQGTMDQYSTFYSMGSFAYLFARKSADEIASSPVEELNEQFDKLCDGISDILTGLEYSISSSVETSYIYKYNMAEADSWVQIDYTTYRVLSKAIEIYEFTGGYYNPAVWYCVDLYGFTTRVEDSDEAAYWRDPVTNEKGNLLYYPLPEEKYVTAFKTLAEGFADVEVKSENGKYYAYKPAHVVEVDGITYSLRLDLGGIGKGWAVGEISDLMDEFGYKHGYLSFASSSMALKEHETAINYTLQARDPRSESNGGLFRIPVKNCELSTSGDYEKYYEIDGTRYCHIINPMTGRPIETGVASVTIVGGSAAEDDALTTAISAMGKEKAVEFINANEEYFEGKTIVFLVFEGDEGKIITNAPDEIEVMNEDYVVANDVVDGKIVLK